MSTGVRCNLLKINCCYRGIAIFFLIFTFLDLSMPALCNEEKLDFFTSSRQAEGTVQVMVSLENTSSEQSDHQSVPDAEDHDCFCCCAHLTLIDSNQTTSLIRQTEAVPRSLINLPVAPPQGTDHPPRLA